MGGCGEEEEKLVANNNKGATERVFAILKTLYL